jgi:hypothetical protein
MAGGSGPPIPSINASARSISASFRESTSPSLLSSLLAATALIARQIARLGRSTPSTLAISGRSADGARELESGTTTISSSLPPAFNASTETTTAGLFLPGSPALAAPSERSHTSPDLA